MTAAGAAAPLLDVRDLDVRFATDAGVLSAVEGFTLRIWPGETVALVGESGSGKSVASLAIMRLLPEPPARIAAGALRFAERDLLALGAAELDALRGNRMAMIFQEPMTSLNPIFRVGEQVAESLRLHRGLSRPVAARQAVTLLRRVGLADPERRAGSYPHELSGGMRQRVMIAMAIACDPQLIIADEPTTALDVTVQAQILGLLDDLRRETGAAVLLITHDLGVVAEVADRVAVIYAGRIVEEGPVAAVFAAPRHPYTEGLLRSVPDVDRPLSDDRMLPSIAGVIPDPLARPSGCRFRNRCEHAFDRCGEEPPPLSAGEGRLARCWRNA